jgi:hypothetical protein
MEAVAHWITSYVPPCIINGSDYSYSTKHSECPTPHVFFIVTMSRILEMGHEWLTALATVVIALFTATLWWSTRGMLRATNASIEVARQELFSSHRPQMRLKHAWFTDQTAWRLNGPLEVILDFVNIGNASARITWINYQSILLPKGARLPQRPPYDEAPPSGVRITRFRIEGILPSGITFPREVCDGILDSQEVHDILWDVRTLYLIGTIEYWDTTNRLRQTAFCRRLTFMSYPPTANDMGRFEIEDDPDYEYED